MIKLILLRYKSYKHKIVKPKKVKPKTKTIDLEIQYQTCVCELEQSNKFTQNLNSQTLGSSLLVDMIIPSILT